MHKKLFQFITLTLVYFFIVYPLQLMIKSYYNIVKVMWIHEHERQASESTTKFDNVMTWRQFAFYYNRTKV